MPICNLRRYATVISRWRGLSRSICTRQFSKAKREKENVRGCERDTWSLIIKTYPVWITRCFLSIIIKLFEFPRVEDATRFLSVSLRPAPTEIFSSSAKNHRPSSPLPSTSRFPSFDRIRSLFFHEFVLSSTRVSRIHHASNRMRSLLPRNSNLSHLRW